ncbi:MAG: hypothetical protein KA229_13510, partial [Chitinophagaceae bacterium]|nr:hypothetical protein [Chitinophagaceae bacterium]
FGEASTLVSAPFARLLIALKRSDMQNNFVQKNVIRRTIPIFLIGCLKNRGKMGKNCAFIGK